MAEKTLTLNESGERECQTKEVARDYIKHRGFDSSCLTPV